MTDSKLVNGIAVIGVSLRVPGASDAAGFWRLLREGRESIALLSQEELERRGVPESLRRRPDFVPAVATPEDVAGFDPAFFGFSPREAEVMDPQLRVFLESSWTALEDAGYDTGKYRGSVGVAAGVGASQYLLSNVQPNLHKLTSLDGLQIRLSNSSGSLATMVSYKLDLRGPSFTVQTACSSSLVAVHLAGQSLLNGECDLMLAGGVSIGSSFGYLYQEGGILSPDGHCRAFDARAAGTVPGSGVGVVVLKRFSDALTDGDTVRAVILGSAVNNDGATKAGYTAPSVVGHAKVATEAMAIAGVEAESIGYLEAHGTGTTVGDPIEIEGLTLAFRETTPKTGFCAIGSVKSNIGHLDHAAGVVSLIKAILALENRQIPPSLHFEKPNPKIDFDATPFYVARRLQDWPSDRSPRRAGVSSLGIGGTNAHVVLEEAPRTPEKPPTTDPELLLISARSAAALEEATSRLGVHLKENPSLPLVDVAHTLHAGRRRFGFRRALVATTGVEAASALESRGSAEIVDGEGRSAQSSLAFLFPGEGAPCRRLAGGIYRRFDVFRSEVDACSRALAPRLGCDLRTADLRSTNLGDPALFVLEYALARLWMSWGCQPEALLGQGIGELVAACLSGVFRLEDALALVAVGSSVPATEREDAVAPMVIQKPRIPMVSSVTGSWLTDEEARDPAYWGRRLRDASQFENGLREVMKAGDRVLLEIGPAVAHANRGASSERLVVASLPRTAPEVSDSDDEVALLRAAGRLWIAGAPLDAAALYADRRARRVPLPTYPFERRRYWLDPPREREATASSSAAVKKASAPEWIYLPCWKSAIAPRPRLEVFGERIRWLVLDDGSPLSRAVVENFRSLGHGVVEAVPGDEFRSLPDGRYRIHPTRPSDYTRLLQELGARDASLDRVVVFWTPNADREAEGMAHRDTRGFEALIYLSRALGQSESEGRVRLFFVSPGIESLAANETIVPSRAMGLAACPVIRQEYPSITASAVDVNPEGDDLETLAERTTAELLREADEVLVALRGRWRHVLSYESVAERVKHRATPRLRQRGTYVITGGLGRLGCVIAEHLARKVKANLALLGRTGLPDRGEWEALLTGSESESDLARRVQAVLRLESLGSEVLVLSADAADSEQMAAAFQAIEGRFGGVDGVIHAAGVLDKRTLIQLGSVTAAEIERQFRPKVDALPVLERLLEGRSVDFVMLMSSLSTVLGGVGYGVYAAANAFMDAFAAERQRKDRTGREPKTNWVSVNWDAWRAVETLARGQGYGSELSRLALTPAEGVEAFDLVLSLDSVPRIAVSTAELNARIERWAKLEDVASAHATEEASAAASRHPRPALGSVYVAPGNETESKLAELWGEILGVDRVGINDNFFELGGSSLHAIRLMPRVEKGLGVKMPTTAIFEGPTVQSFGELVAARGSKR